MRTRSEHVRACAVAAVVASFVLVTGCSGGENSGTADPGDGSPPSSTEPASDPVTTEQLRAAISSITPGEQPTLTQPDPGDESTAVDAVQNLGLENDSINPTECARVLPGRQAEDWRGQGDVAVGTSATPEPRVITTIAAQAHVDQVDFDLPPECTIAEYSTAGGETLGTVTFLDVAGDGDDTLAYAVRMGTESLGDDPTDLVHTYYMLMTTYRGALIALGRSGEAPLRPDQTTIDGLVGTANEVIANLRRS